MSYSSLLNGVVLCSIFISSLQELGVKYVAHLILTVCEIEDVPEANLCGSFV